MDGHHWRTGRRVSYLRSRMTLQYRVDTGALLYFSYGSNIDKLMAECGCGLCTDCCPPLKQSYTVTISGVTPSSFDGVHVVTWLEELSWRCTWASEDGGVKLHWNKQPGGTWYVSSPVSGWYSDCVPNTHSGAFWGSSDACAPEGAYTPVQPGRSYVCTSTCVVS